ncbi:HAD hydrolase-like protein [Nocardioides caeni]
MRSSRGPLTDDHDLAMLDLDGVVYVGPAAVPGAAQNLSRARTLGLRLAFITNNASREASVVAQHLTELGIPAAADEVVTSAQAAARLLVDRWGQGAAVVCLGGPGLAAALGEAGLIPVAVDAEAVAVASGYGPDVRWAEITRVAIRIRDGLPWVASNTDATFPTPDGLAPGHGVLVTMLSSFTGVQPLVAGKPERPLLDETVRRTGGRRPLMVGDRLDTDIAGAHRAGMASLLVLTGVTGLPELVAARPDERPTYLAPDLAGLVEAHAAPVRATPGRAGSTAGWAAGGWSARVDDGRLVLDPTAPDAAVDDWWRAAAAAAWEHLDASGDVVDISDLDVPDPTPPAR